MYLTSLLSLGLFVVAAAADWSTEEWDAIIVGAGPAGIIGQSPIDKSEIYTDQLKLRVVWQQQVSKHF